MYLCAIIYIYIYKQYYYIIIMRASGYRVDGRTTTIQQLVRPVEGGKIK